MVVGGGGLSEGAVQGEFGSQAEQLLLEGVDAVGVREGAVVLGGGREGRRREGFQRFGVF